MHMNKVVLSHPAENTRQLNSCDLNTKLFHKIQEKLDWMLSLCILFESITCIHTDSD